MKHKKYLVFSIVLIFLSSAFAFYSENQEKITTETLLQEMVDLWQLTEFPEPEYKTIQFSSTDRRSTVPGGPGWFSNSDGFGGEPIPNFEKVLSEPDEEGGMPDIKEPKVNIDFIWVQKINE